MADKDRKEVSRSEQARQPERRAGGDLFELDPGEFFANPFAVMRRMHDEMDRIFAGALGQQAGRAAMGGLAAWPAVEVSEKDNQVNVCAELPGIPPEDVRVEVLENTLVIEGERKQERDEEAEACGGPSGVTAGFTVRYRFRKGQRQKKPVRSSGTANSESPFLWIGSKANVDRYQLAAVRRSSCRPPDAADRLHAT